MKRIDLTVNGKTTTMCYERITVFDNGNIVFLNEKGELIGGINFGTFWQIEEKLVQ